MLPDPAFVPTRALVRELAGRSPVLLRRLARGQSRRRRARSAPVSREPFAAFEREGRSPVELSPTYRDSIKARWRTQFWQVRLLLELHARFELPERLHRLALDILEHPTLRLPPAEVGAELTSFLPQFRERIQTTELVDPVDGTQRIDFKPTADDLRDTSDYYRATARQILRRLRAQGLEPSHSRMLEVGCSTGYMVLAMQAAGVDEAVGVDSDPAASSGDEHARAIMSKHLLGGEDAGPRVIEADAADMPFPDASFDAVFSIGAFEHFNSPGAVLRETRRVLRPGGLGYHTVGPWFSPEGGHAMCTLDFPWGHVRLTPAEFDRYVASYREHELPYARHHYAHHFQNPRLSIAETEREVLRAGLELVDVQTLTDYGDHVRLIDEPLLTDCAAVFPDVTVRDLTTNNYVMMVRAPKS